MRAESESCTLESAVVSPLTPGVAAVACTSAASFFDRILELNLFGSSISSSRPRGFVCIDCGELVGFFLQKMIVPLLFKLAIPLIYWFLPRPWKVSFEGTLLYSGSVLFLTDVTFFNLF